MKITRALISVSDKIGLVEFARELDKLGVEIISTGGTGELLRHNGVAVREISNLTGFPEVLDGRVKTLHPKVHGGLLYIRGNPEHEAAARECGFEPIDLLVVNLYPFEATIAKPGVSLAEAIEQIDIGGPSMLRSAAKITNQSRSSSIRLITMKFSRQCAITTARRRSSCASAFAIKVFVTTAHYDQTIANFLNKEQTTDASFSLALPLVTRLRYGENPHQSASLYGNFDECFEKLHGKELSFNNILDISAASDLISEFAEPTIAILKHTNPCGVGSDNDLREAWMKAFATDKQAPFGGIIICNRPLALPLAKAISEIFSEVIIAPEFEPDARALLQKEKPAADPIAHPSGSEKTPLDLRSVRGGLLVQEKDTAELKGLETKVVTKRPPTKKKWRRCFSAGVL